MWRRREVLGALNGKREIQSLSLCVCGYVCVCVHLQHLGTFTSTVHTGRGVRVVRSTWSGRSESETGGERMRRSQSIQWLNLLLPCN